MAIYHTIKVASSKWPDIDLIPAPDISIESGQLIITAGGWPDFGGEVIWILNHTITLDAQDAFVQLARNGDIYLSKDQLAYGPHLPLADLLAWVEDEEWHIKKLEVV